MKKTLSVCMAAVLALASLPVLGVSAAETTYALGDVDMDGVVTGHDTAMVSRYVLDDTYSLTDEQLQQAADGFANSVKSAVIARYKMKPSERKEEFTGKEAAFLSKLFNL